MQLQNITWEEVEKFREECKGVVIIPVGSTEQHAAHLPLGTDTLLAISLAEEVGQKARALVTPPLYFGWSPHHLALPGTISIRPEVLSEVLFDVIRSLATHKFDKFIVINGHRIVNIPWMQIAAERAQRELKVKVFLFDPAYASRSLVRKLGFHGVGHADDIETSHMLYCYPDLVQMDKAVDFSVTPDLPYTVDPSELKDTLCYVPSMKETIARLARESKGTSGFPTSASREKGQEYHNHLVKFLIDAINRIRAGDDA